MPHEKNDAVVLPNYRFVKISDTVLMTFPGVWLVISASYILHWIV
jgi:hypothetical protein